ncbi:hypothetical protein ACJVC5_01780 [Peredibacter sp. HCB2-198]|uniref:hypothetical protein n=1 Tax=Peredibacter sp. HCB2-198 TaxID=3383025 RepID=UPI0038B657F7
MKFILLLAVLMLALSGCGDLLGSKVKKKELSTSQFEVNCELDMNEFSEIMNKNIESQIQCLGENLHLFIRVVKSGKPGHLSRVQLEEYLRVFRPDVQPEVVKALKAVFDLGHLIAGEDPDYISKDTVDKVINFAVVFNREASLNFGPIFQNESEVTYALHQNHRDRVSTANKAIVQALRKIFKSDRGGNIHKLNIMDLLESFTTEDTRQDIERVKKVLFVKKLMLGGDEDHLTHIELEKLILNFDHLLLIGLDAVRYKYIILNQESILQLLKRDVNDLYDIVTQGDLNNRDQEVLFTMDQAIEAVKEFVEKDDFDVEKYRNMIGEAKKILMNGNTDEVRGIELKNFFVHAKTLLQSGTIFHRIYDKFKVQLESSQPVSIDFDEYRHTYPEHQKELDQFERIVKKYRFMKGEFLAPYYTRGYRRNADAVFEIALFEYAIKLVFQVYGSPSPNPDAVGGFSMDQKQMQALLKKFEQELIDMDLILPGKIEGTADNVSLLGTLFQYQSDTNNKLDVNEMTEFGVSLFAALNIQGDLFTYLEEDMACPKDQFGRILPECFKANFWKGVCKDYRPYLPLMFESMGAPKNCDEFVPNEAAQKFLETTIDAARSCNFYSDGDKEQVPFEKGDIMTTMIALMHIETTILRWDTNGNNLLDADEVNNAYTIYSGALDGFLKDKNPIIKKFQKQIYQFMIKYEQVPDEKDFGSIWKFVKFLLSFDKKAPANRKTIASLLVAISEQNAKNRTTPSFDCNLLRDPDNIPRNPNTVLPAVDNRQDFSSILTPYLHLAN